MALSTSALHGELGPPPLKAKTQVLTLVTRWHAALCYLAPSPCFLPSQQSTLLPHLPQTPPGSPILGGVL